jgi:signal transduction histidine kinase
MQAPLWRSLAIFRSASVVYAMILVLIRPYDYKYLGWTWFVLAAMAAWTVVSTIGYSVPARRTRLLLSADLLLTCAALLSTDLLQVPLALKAGVMPVTATWLAGPALVWAVTYGVRAGAITAIVIGGCTVVLRQQHPPVVYQSTALDGPIILLMAAMLTGYISTLTTRAEEALQRATEIEAASRERERLARTIHDSVLQVLAMVQRRGAEAGGEAAEIGRLAGEQEAMLRTLVSTDGQGSLPAGELDLSASLALETSTTVSVITPAEPVLMQERAVQEATAAVREAIDNVRRHCGEQARAWVLVDDEGDIVSVTIRDDGPGIPAGRLAEAAAEGRLGVSQAIGGRIRDLGGSADIASTPGAGTEVRLRVPRSGVMPDRAAVAGRHSGAALTRGRRRD